MPNLLVFIAFYLKWPECCPECKNSGQRYLLVLIIFFLFLSQIPNNIEVLYVEITLLCVYTYDTLHIVRVEPFLTTNLGQFGTGNISPYFSIIYRRPKSVPVPKDFSTQQKRGPKPHPPWYHCSSNLGYYVIQSGRTPPIDATPLPVDSYPAEQSIASVR